MYKLALDVIIKIINEHAYTNIIVSQTIENNNLVDHEKRLFTKIVYGVVENKILLDYYLQPYVVGKRLKPYMKNTLRMGAYMITFMNIANHFVCNTLVEMVKKKDYKGAMLINGVLRKYAKDERLNITNQTREEYLSIKYSYPLAVVKYLQSQYRDELEDILSPSQEYAMNTYRINTLKTSPDAIRNYLDSQDINYECHNLVLKTSANLLETNLFKEGKVVFQDEASQQVALIVDPRPGDVILDACSAPGGKSSQMAAIMNNQGTILAIDIHEHKIALINDTIKRTGVLIVKAQLSDARNFQSTNLFDHILIDAPCSGLGVMKHKVDLKYNIDINELPNLVNIQKAMLDNLYRFVKPGGYLTYSTCTINKNENEKQIMEFIINHPEFTKIYEKQLLPVAESDGFYICKLQKAKAKGLV